MRLVQDENERRIKKYGLIGGENCKGKDIYNAIIRASVRVLTLKETNT